MSYFHLSKAPIVEAVIDFGVVPRRDFGLADIEKFKDSLAPNYAQKHAVYDMEGEITFDLGTGKTLEKIEESSRVGYRLENSSGDRAVNVTLHGISFHKLHPYSDWDTVFDEAWELWLQYRTSTKPESIRRLAARYINRLQLPRPTKLSEYLRGPILTSADFLVGGYVKRMNLVEKQTGLRANVVEAVEIPRSDVSETVVIIIDNDVYTTRVPTPDSDDDMQKLFASIHILKNKLFWESVTDQVLEMYK